MSSQIIVVDCSPRPDRTIFWRDVEATQRMSNPKNIKKFLDDLIQVRAYYEADEIYSSRIKNALSCTEAEYDGMVRSIAYQLFKECEQRGYFNAGRILHIKIQSKLKRT